MKSLELNALGFGVFRLGAFFLFFHNKIDGLDLFFRGFRFFGRHFFPERTPTENGEFDAVNDKEAERKQKQYVQYAETLNG